jgi:hypothetical protein
VKLNLPRLMVLPIALSLMLLACSTNKPADPSQVATVAPVAAPVSAAPTTARPAWMPAPVTSLAYASRVGIMNVLDNEIVHVKSGTIGLGNDSKATRAEFDLPGYVNESLRKGLLAQTPYKPILIRPSAKLVRDKAVWQKTWDAKSGSFGSGDRKSVV